MALSKSSSVFWGHVKGQAVRLDLVSIGNGLLLRRDAAEKWLEMVAAAAAEGVRLEAESAYRTFEQQQQLRLLYEAGKGNLAAEPGFSNHEGGIAVDAKAAGGTNAAFAWLTKNAARFGWRRTVSSEPWHWEYRP